MSALPASEIDIQVGPGGELEQVVAEIARSEAALDDLILRAGRLHSSNIGHEQTSCILCFADR